VNDTWGHDAGDVVLKWIAKTIVATKRGVDVAARFGGEEIAVLLPETDLAGAREVAERMRKAVESLPVHAAGAEIPVTISLGVACYPDGVLTKEALFAAADRAMYDAKSAGRNCVRAAIPKPTGVAS
jgi:diguanylate cyclase (GGDEF)-like protein